MLSDLAFSSWSVDSLSLFTDVEELTLLCSPPPPFLFFFFFFFILIFKVKAGFKIFYFLLAKKELEERHIKNKSFSGVDLAGLDLVERHT